LILKPPDKNVDGTILMLLTLEDLKVDLGIDVFGERTRVFKRITNLRSRWTSTDASNPILPSYSE
jgi:hypothetical protein